MRHVPLLLAAAAITVLVVLTVRFAGSSDVGAADRALPVLATVAAPTIAPPSWQSCPFPAKDAGEGDRLLSVTGTCSGEIVEPLICAEGDEGLNGSVRVEVDAQQEFFITIIVPEFDGAGDYEGAELFAQLIGPAGVLRWTNRAVPISVDADGVIRLEQIDLDAEPGTPTAGLLILDGSVACG